MKKYLYQLSALTMFLLMVTWASCSSEFDKVVPVITSSDSVANGLKTQKILIIVADGARGQAVRESAAPNLTEIAKTATVSWVSLSEEVPNEGTSWADMFTGVAKEKHGVVNNNFSSNNFKDYPLVFQRIKTAKPNTRIATFAYTTAFSNNLAAGTDVSQSFNSDSEVKTALVNELANDNANVVVGVFGGINTAGANFGYDNSVPQYKASILTFDGYLGEALTALKNRKNYAGENWLVIVTSSMGGNYVVNNNDGTIFSNPKANTFTVFYNPAYKLKVIDKPYTGNRYEAKFVRLYSPSTATLTTTSIRGEVRGDNSAYNFGNKDFTIELKVKKRPLANGSYTYNWPVFFAKKASKTKKSGPGWGFAWEGNMWRFFIGNSIDNAFFNADGPTVSDPNWHTLSVVVGTSGTNRLVRTFMDGVFFRQYTISANYITTIDDVLSPLTVGFVETDTTNPFDGYISDIRIWLAALPDAAIAQFACDIYVTSGHPYYNVLAGNWPCTDGVGGVFKDVSSLGNDFTILQGGTTRIPGTPLGNLTSWETINSIICPPTTTNLATFVPSTKDIAPQVFSWLAILPSETWKLDGRVWLNQ